MMMMNKAFFLLAACVVSVEAKEASPSLWKRMEEVKNAQANHGKNKNIRGQRTLQGATELCAAKTVDGVIGNACVFCEACEADKITCTVDSYSSWDYPDGTSSVKFCTGFSQGPNAGKTFCVNMQEGTYTVRTPLDKEEYAVEACELTYDDPTCTSPLDGCCFFVDCTKIAYPLVDDWRTAFNTCDENAKEDPVVPQCDAYLFTPEQLLLAPPAPVVTVEDSAMVPTMEGTMMGTTTGTIGGSTTATIANS